MLIVALETPSAITDSVVSSDVLIVGAGIIGLSLALELRRRGASVTVLEQAAAFRGASSAAAGMLAAEDPHNPPAMLQFSRYSLSLYETYLVRLEELSGQAVPFQTNLTIQHTASSSYELPERSVDPRQLGAALLAAARAMSAKVVEHTPHLCLEVTAAGVEMRAQDGTRYRAAEVVHTTGAWASPYLPGLAISPRKGQMLRVVIPAGSPLHVVHRAEHVYVVPRTFGPQAGTALIGATVEDASFDLSTDATQLARLREAAAALAPETSFAANAPMVEAWAGSRPYTPDLLPLLGQLRERKWIAAGHFRNGILLAPGTASVLADLITGRRPQVDLAPFTPHRSGVIR